jgi:hypothetical protein
MGNGHVCNVCNICNVATSTPSATSAPAPLLQATTFGAAEVCLELATVVGSLAPLACAAGLLRRSGLVVVVGGSAMATAVLLSTVLQSSVYWSCVPL